MRPAGRILGTGVCFVVGCDAGEIIDEGFSESSEVRHGGYNCNRDKRVDAPGTFTAEAVSPLKLHVTMAEGADPAGIADHSFVLTDPAGVSTSLSTLVRGCYSAGT